MQVDQILHSFYTLFVVFLSLLILILFILKFDSRVIHSPYYIFLQSVVWFGLASSLTAPASTLQSLESNSTYNFYGYAVFGGLAVISAVLITLGLFIGGYITIIQRFGLSWKDIPTHWNEASRDNRAVVIAVSGLIIGNIIVLIGLILIPFSGTNIVTTVGNEIFLPTMVFCGIIILGYLLVYLYILKLYLYSDVHLVGEYAKNQTALILGLVIIFQLMQLIPVITAGYYIYLVTATFTSFPYISYLSLIYGIGPFLVIGELFCLGSLLYLLLLRMRSIKLDIPVSNATKDIAQD